MEAGHAASVMAGLVPAIHVLLFPRLQKTWMPGTRPGMTRRKTMMPRKVRERLRVKPGDTLRYRLTENSVVPDKTGTGELTDPFATFSEWSNEADEKAYSCL